MEPITASDVATLVYCPRKLWLIGEGARPNHEDVVRGEIAHQAVDHSSRTVVVTDDVLGVRGVCVMSLMATTLWSTNPADLEASQ